MTENEVTVASVRQQVIGLERGHGELRQELHSVEQKMDRGFIAVDQKMAEGFNSIAGKLDEKTTPQWQAYGVIVSVLIAICGALIWPIRDQSNKQDVSIERLVESTTKLSHDLGYLEGQLHPIMK
ncbi:MAG: hypothetical protein ACXWNL_16215 [Vulcanimicrobiaceae bacterium]